MSDVLGWLAVAAIIAAVGVGIFLRRMRRVPALIVRMRPHFALGYFSLASAFAHVALAWGGMSMGQALGLKAASIAFCALGAQTFVGASLQDPGDYRSVLRAWHIGIVVLLAISLLVHIMASGAL